MRLPRQTNLNTQGSSYNTSLCGLPSMRTPLAKFGCRTMNEFSTTPGARFGDGKPPTRLAPVQIELQTADPLTRWFPVAHPDSNEFPSQASAAYIIAPWTS